MSDIPVKPTGWNVLLRVKPVENKSEGGIVLATLQEEERQNRGQDILEVVAVGDGAFKGEQFADCKTPFCVAGDYVMTPRYPGHSFEYPKGSKIYYYMANDTDIKGVVNPECLSDLLR